MWLCKVITYLSLARDLQVLALFFRVIRFLPLTLRLATEFQIFEQIIVLFVSLNWTTKCGLLPFDVVVVVIAPTLPIGDQTGIRVPTFGRESNVHKILDNVICLENCALQTCQSLTTISPVIGSHIPCFFIQAKSMVTNRNIIASCREIRIHACCL